MRSHVTSKAPLNVISMIEFAETFGSRLEQSEMYRGLDICNQRCHSNKVENIPCSCGHQGTHNDTNTFFLLFHLPDLKTMIYCDNDRQKY